MADPVSATLIIGSAAAQFQQSYEQAKAAGVAADINSNAAVESAGISYESLDARAREEATRAGLTIARVRADAMNAKGHVAVAAASSGVKGGSVQAVIDDFTSQEGKRVTAAILNEQYARANVEREKQGVKLATQSKLASSMAPVGPSLFNAALSAFAGVASNEAQIKAAQDGN